VPSSKPPHLNKPSTPETTLLDRVAYPPAQKETPAAAAPGEETRTQAEEAGSSGQFFPEDIHREPQPDAFHQSLIQQVKKQPRNPTLWILLGWSSADARRAAEYFQHAVDLDPENLLARECLGWASSEIGPAIAESMATPGTPDEISEEAPAEAHVQKSAQPVAQAESSAAAVQGITAFPTRPPPKNIQDFRWRTLSRFYYIPFLRNLIIALVYLILICAAEGITVLFNPTLGVIFHSVIMIALIVHGSIIQQGPFRRFLIMLALAPLIRLMSLSLPLSGFAIPTMYRYMIVGVPIMVAAYFAARSVGLTANRLYFTWKGWPIQLLFSLTGLILGYCEYLILHPAELVPSTGWFDIAMGVFILLIFTGFLEELIFRSLLQVTGIQVFGGIAIGIISILFGILHIGYFSAVDVIFAAAVGLFFGIFALRTRSLLGISLAHGIINITLYIILPMILH